MCRELSHLAVVMFATGLLASDAWADPIDLTSWAAESYAVLDSYPDAEWTVSATGTEVTQGRNAQPTVFYSDFLTQGSPVSGSFRGSGDDDFVGFVFGFNPGDTTSDSADYLLVDWKRGDQDFDWGAPSGDPGGTASAGLAVSRVSGVPTADEFWQHATYSGGGVTELQRGATLGSSAWDGAVTYQFDFIFQPDQFQVFVNGVPELNITGTFANGRMGFYNFSQAVTTYGAATVQSVPEPATWLLLASGVLTLIGRRR